MITLGFSWTKFDYEFGNSQTLQSTIRKYVFTY